MTPTRLQAVVLQLLWASGSVETMQIYGKKEGTRASSGSCIDLSLNEDKN